MNIYIGGDSFCACRTDINVNWPSIVATKLNRQLLGEGFSGCSWWPTRNHLIEHLSSPKAIDTDIYIFCHTSQYRMIAPLDNLNWGSPDEINLDPFPHPRDGSDARAFKRFYYKHVQSNAVADWMQQNWFRELNTLLPNKQVLHLPCFQETIPNTVLLDGVVYKNPLLTLSILDLPIDTEYINDTRPNHFTAAGEENLSNIILEILQ